MREQAYGAVVGVALRFSPPYSVAGRQPGEDFVLLWWRDCAVTHLRGGHSEGWTQGARRLARGTSHRRSPDELGAHAVGYSSSGRPLAAVGCDRLRCVYAGFCHEPELSAICGCP